MEFLLTNIRMWVYWLRVRETYDTRTPACTCIWASLDYSILIPCMGYILHVQFYSNRKKAWIDRESIVNNVTLVNISSSSLLVKGARDLWAGRDLYRATPNVTRGLGFYAVLSEGPFHLVAKNDKQVIWGSV